MTPAFHPRTSLYDSFVTLLASPGLSIHAPIRHYTRAIFKTHHHVSVVLFSRLLLFTRRVVQFLWPLLLFHLDNDHQCVYIDVNNFLLRSYLPTLVPVEIEELKAPLRHVNGSGLCSPASSFFTSEAWSTMTSSKFTSSYVLSLRSHISSLDPPTFFYRTSLRSFRF
jgi:hypothetical protein